MVKKVNLVEIEDYTGPYCGQGGFGIIYSAFEFYFSSLVLGLNKNSIFK